MKKILLAAILGISLPYTPYSQSPSWPSLEDPGYNEYFLAQNFHPVIHGQINGLAPDSLRRIEISYSVVTPFRRLQDGHTARVDDSGQFNLVLDYPFAGQQVWLSVGDLAYMEIDVRRELTVTIDAAIIRKEILFYGDGIRFGGADGELTKIMNQHTLFRRKEQLALDSISQMIRLNRSISHQQFAQIHDSVFAELEKIDMEFVKQHPSPYGWLIKNERLSTYYGNICLWYGNKPMNQDDWERVKGHKTYLVSNSGMTFYRYLNMYFELNNFRTYRYPWQLLMDQTGLTAETQKDLGTAFRLDNLRADGHVYDTVKLEELEAWAKREFDLEIADDRFSRLLGTIDREVNRSKADCLRLNIGDTDLKAQARKDSVMLGQLHAEWCKILLETEYGKLQMQLADIDSMDTHNPTFVSTDGIGVPVAVTPFGAKLYRVDSANAKSFLANLKDAFDHKALVIDFWATWCAPCLSDMPYSRKMHEAVKDEPVEFVYLCTSGGSNIDKWKTKIMELRLPGTHIFVDNAVETELMRFFSFSGYPSIAFYDKNGRYVGNAISRMSHITAAELSNLIHGKKR